jgi:putative ABC transport system permease protein
MHGFRQIGTVTDLNIRNLRQRLWSSLVIVAGVACVVGVLLSMLSFTTGINRTVAAGAQPDGAIVTISGQNDEYGQGITREAAAAILNAPGIAKKPDGTPLASTENLNNIPATRRDDALPVRMILRGVGPQAFEIRPDFRLVNGRMFQPGTRELIVGTAAQAQFTNLAVGEKVIMPDGEWTIVGAFESGGDRIDGQLLGEIDTVLAARRQNGYGSILAKLESPEAFEPFKAAVTSIPGLRVDVLRPAEFYARNIEGFTTFFSTVAYLLGSIMAIGALFGTVNIMHSAVAARTREIATLRALGFGAMPVAISVITEVMLLALAGAVIGAAVAWLLFNGNRNSVGGFVVFDLVITPGLLTLGVVWALAIALLGGIVPAIRAARLPVVTALRAA